MTDADLYGTSPMMAALADIRAFNTLPADDRRKALIAYVEHQIATDELVCMFDITAYSGLKLAMIVLGTDKI